MKTKLLLILAFAAILSACSSDDDKSSSQSQTDLIIGTWKHYKVDFDPENGNPIQTSEAGAPCGFWSIDTFTENETYIHQDINDINCEPTGTPESGDYYVEDGYLIHPHNDGENVTWKIDRLTNNELILSDDQETLYYKK